MECISPCSAVMLHVGSSTVHQEMLHASCVMCDASEIYTQHAWKLFVWEKRTSRALARALHQSCQTIKVKHHVKQAGGVQPSMWQAGQWNHPNSFYWPARSWYHTAAPTNSIPSSSLVSRHSSLNLVYATVGPANTNGFDQVSPMPFGLLTSPATVAIEMLR